MSGRVDYQNHLEESEERYRLAAERSAVGMGLVDPEAALVTAPAA